MPSVTWWNAGNVCGLLVRILKMVEHMRHERTQEDMGTYFLFLGTALCPQSPFI
jgi:hypothetical protein